MQNIFTMEYSQLQDLQLRLQMDLITTTDEWTAKQCSMRLQMIELALEEKEV